ncbi:hypothetical protein [Trichormus sp. NMC-1]|uniref:hypothetical protein n=1 Tax=Trichormus sp. NMC-1 TaxID=1853259 RepID=UPI0008DC0E70|nr:hypothetical protein [Trichormus sp. NMC-1]
MLLLQELSELLPAEDPEARQTITGVNWENYEALLNDLGCFKSLTWAIRNHAYTDKTCLRRFETLNFSLVQASGLSLCSSVSLTGAGGSIIFAENF